MSSDDFSMHTDDCEEVDDGMPVSDLPDEVTSIDDLDRVLEQVRLTFRN